MSKIKYLDEVRTQELIDEIKRRIKSGGGEGGGGDVTLPHLFVRTIEPRAAINAGDFLITSQELEVSFLKKYQNGNWTEVDFLYGNNPELLTEEGVYYVFIDENDFRDILTKIGDNIVSVAAPATNPGTSNNVFFVNDVDIDDVKVGDHWIEIEIINDTDRVAKALYEYSVEKGWDQLFTFGSIVNTGNGLEYDANEKLQLKLGAGLEFDSNGAVQLSIEPTVNIEYGLIYP